MQIDVALAGNPNVGKSTVFNALTGMRQHTGNWSGKTVEKKTGSATLHGDTFRITDLPGAYSLTAHSAEEEVTRDYIHAAATRGEVVVVVCDGGALERNLSLCLEVLAVTTRTVVCVNLMDEAEKRGISVDAETLVDRLGCPVVLCAARSGRGLPTLAAAIRRAAAADISSPVFTENIPARAKEIAAAAVACTNAAPDRLDRRLDAWFTGRFTAFPCMLFFLFVLFWITLRGAGYLSDGLTAVFDAVLALLRGCTRHCPDAVRGFLIEGVLSTTLTVVAVMLPPMAIFFPLFSLLEDAGFLPRAAFNTDRMFASCGACGKQCLTMMMGFGCNAVGVTGCRIIDSPRERRIAMLTNAFVPCNGRFPMVLTLLTVLCRDPARAAVGFVGCLALSLAVTLAVSRVLSGTVLRGCASSFALELPPYRRPQFAKTIARAVVDRILHVLGRAAAVAAPAGAALWLIGTVRVGDASLLCHFIRFLNTIGELFGMDGVILSGFVLSLPAAEIFYPLVADGYAACGIPFSGAADWSTGTALCVLLFTIFHWPCATTLWTIRRESGSVRDMLWSAAIPTAIGLALCWLVALWR